MDASFWLAEALDESPSLVGEREVLKLCLAGKLRLCWEPTNYYAVPVAPTNFLKNFFGGGEDDPTRRPSFDLEKMEFYFAEAKGKTVEEGLEILSDQVSILEGVYEILWKESHLERWLLGLSKDNLEYDQIIGALILKSIDGTDQWYEVREEYPDNDQSKLTPIYGIDRWYPSAHRPDMRELVIVRSDLEQFVAIEKKAHGLPALQSTDHPFVLPENSDDLARAICGYGNEYFSKRGEVPEPMTLFDLVSSDTQKYGVQKVSSNGAMLGYINSASELKTVDKKAYLARYSRYFKLGSN
jgi:hypothetical protein